MIPLGAVFAFFNPLPLWVSGLIVGLVIGYTLCILGVVIGKTGRSPFWSLLLFLPGTLIVLFCVLAFRRWPVRA